MRYRLLLATIGHINHGKTSLIRSLTGINADRLPEEQIRQMTIDLGFAYLQEKETLLSFLDVPGHTTFLSNMLASLHSVQACLLVVSAHKGIQEQTKEHLLLSQLANIKQGVCVITNTDLVSQDTLQQRTNEIKKLVETTYLETAPCFCVSSKTQKGMKQLKEYLINLAQTQHNKNLPFRYIIDRSFTIKGKGTIITGSVCQGQATEKDSFFLFPNKQKLSIREIQRHMQPVHSCMQGDRIAFNIKHISCNEIHRGMQITTNSHLHTGYSFYIKLNLVKTISSFNKTKKIRLFSHAQNTIASLTLYKNTLQDNSSCIAKITTSSIFVYALQDNVIIRELHQAETFASGRIILDLPNRLLPFLTNKLSVLSQLAWGNLDKQLYSLLCFEKNFIFTKQAVRYKLLLSQTKFDIIWDKLIKTKQILAISSQNYILQASLDYITKKIIIFLSVFHQKNPSLAGSSQSNLSFLFLPKEVKQINLILSLLVQQKKIVFTNSQLYCLPFFSQTKTVSKEVEIILDFIKKNDPVSMNYLTTSLTLSSNQIKAALTTAKQLRLCVATQTNLFFHYKTIEKAKKILYDYFRKHSSLDMQTWKAISMTSRKKAIALLEYFDSENITKQINHIRYLQLPK